MRRSSKIFCGQIVLVASLALIGTSAVRADQVDASSNDAPPASRTEEKRLHSIPEDGMVEAPIRLTRAVRELMALRPNEDLIICVAGCTPGRDPVIYAQPLEKPEVANVEAAAPAVAAKPAEVMPASTEPAEPVSNAVEPANEDQAANVPAKSEVSEPVATAADPAVLNKSEASETPPMDADAAATQSSDATSGTVDQPSFEPTSDATPATEDTGDTVMPTGEDAPR